MAILHTTYFSTLMIRACCCWLKPLMVPNLVLLAMITSGLGSHSLLGPFRPLFSEQSRTVRLVLAWTTGWISSSSSSPRGCLWFCDILTFCPGLISRTINCWGSPPGIDLQPHFSYSTSYLSLASVSQSNPRSGRSLGMEGEETTDRFINRQCRESVAVNSWWTIQF